MADSSPIVTLLAQRSAEDLEAMRLKAETLLNDTKYELDLIERALAVKQPQRTRRRSRRGDTKKRILDFIAASSEPVGPADVRDGLNATGAPIGSSAVYNMFRRLTEAGDLERVAEGLYTIATGSSSENGGPGGEKIEDTEPLSRATDPHEGPND